MCSFALSPPTASALRAAPAHPARFAASVHGSVQCMHTALRSRPLSGAASSAPSPTAVYAQRCMGGRSCRPPASRQGLAPGMCRAGPEAATSDAEDANSLSTAEMRPVRESGGQPTAFPAVPGVYAVYDSSNTLQYIGLSRKVSVSILNHMEDLPELVAAVKLLAVADVSKEGLTDAWKSWIQAGVEELGAIPAGNAPGEVKWTRRARAAKPEIKLTPGKGAGDVTVPLEQILDAVVSQNRVVAFIKGTRLAPQCGFSHKVLTILNESRANFEVVNVLDEIYNPGLRDVIKTYSQWPTIPQLYVDGELVGGADIVEEMHTKGELKQILTPPT